MDRISLILESPGRPNDRLDLETAPYQSDLSISHLLTLRRLPKGDVYRQSHGRGVDSLRLIGTFGLEERDGQTGTQLYFELKRYVEAYLAFMNAADEKTRRGTRLQYHHWDEDEHWYAEITRFGQPRSSSNKLHYIYEIDLQPHTKITRKYNEEPTPKRTAARKQAQAMQDAATDLQTKTTGLAALRQDVADHINRNVLQPFQKFSSILEQTVSEGLDYVAVKLGDLRDLLTAIDAGMDMLETLDDEALIEAALSLDTLRRPILALMARTELIKESVEDILSVLLDDTVGDIDRAPPAARGVRSVSTRANDTLPKVAARELGDSERWPELAVLNNLYKPPYLADASSVQSGQIAWGSSLLVPTTDESLSPANVGALADESLIYQRNLEARFYGVDLKLRETDRGKLDIILDPSNGNPSTIAGRDNLLQAVTLKTRIYQGQLLENPTWGLRRLVGERMTQDQLDQAKWGLREAAESDPRIEDVAVSLSAVGNLADAEFDVTPATVQAANLTTGSA